MKSVRPRKVSTLQFGQEVECAAIESKSSRQRKLDIPCIGKLEDGRIVLFDKKSNLSKVIKPGDKIKGRVLVAKPSFVIIEPDSIVEQGVQLSTEAKKEVESSKWDSSLIVSIRREKEKQKSPDLDRALKLISKALYGERTHYILELIQNAEDEGASGMSFTICPDRIVVWNNGESFTAEDVENICSVKSGKRNKIGFFGVGFKSVFNITDRPEIISGKYNFQLERFIYPSPSATAPPTDFDPKRGAWFILPYDNSKHKPENIEDSMKEIDEKTLLFLPNLTEITFMNTISGHSWYLERSETEGGVISLFNSSTGAMSLWRVFSKDLKVPEQFRMTDEIRQRPELTRIAVAFPVPRNGEMHDVTAEPIYCYLPTQKRTDMPFLIQGDFDPTVGRENIKDNEWNKWLLLQVGELVVDAYQILRENDVPHDLLFKYVPMNEEIKDQTLREVYDVMQTKMKVSKIAPTEDGDWVIPANVVIDTSEGDLKNLIGTDVKKLKGEGVGYLSPTVGERGRSILIELGAQQIGIDDLITYVQREELVNVHAAKGPEWFLQLYVYLGNEFYEGKTPLSAESYTNQVNKLRESKIILTARNELIAVRDKSKTGLVIFYPHKMSLEEEYKAFSEGEVDFMHHYFQKDTILRKKSVDPALESLRDKAKEFLSYLGIRLYFDDYTLINDVICKCLQHPDRLSEDTIIAYTNFVLGNIQRYVSLARSKYQTTKSEEEVLQSLGDRLIVKVYHLDNEGKVEAFVKASEAYLSEAYGDRSMEELFAVVPNIFFLSEMYATHGDPKKWSEFFQNIGVWKCPRIIRVENTQVHFGDSSYNWVPMYGYGTHALEGDWTSPELQALLAHAKSLERETASKRLEKLWNTLDENWSKVYQKARNCIYIYTPISRPQRKKVDNTSFLNLLRTTQWVLASDGSFYEPARLFTNTEKNRILLGSSVKYLVHEGHQAFIKDLNVREIPTKDEVICHLRQLKTSGVTYTKGTLEKLKTIYAFLMALPDNSSDEETEIVQNIRKMLEQEELLYIPRTDREWWSPSKVFWKDQNQVFGKLRGYLSSFYDSGAFPVFESIQVKETADLGDCISVLKEISESEEITETTQATINNVYLECDRLLSTSNDVDEEIRNLKALNLLVKPKHGKHQFIPLSGIVFADDEQLATNFAENLEILWLGCSYLEITNFLSALGIEPISSLVEVEVDAVDIVDATIQVTENFREWRYYLDLWVKYKKPKLYPVFVDGLKKLGEIQIVEAQKIGLTYKLRQNNEIKKSLTSDVYYDKQLNRLYLCASIDSYAPKIASELCRIFDGGEALKEPILALLSAGQDDKKRMEIFEQFGIPKEGLPNLIMEKIEARQIQEEIVIPVTPKPTETPEENIDETKTDTSIINIPQQIIQLGPFLIDPNDYLLDEIKELETSSPSNSPNSVNTKPIVRATKKIGPVTRKRTVKVTVSPQLPEDIAFELTRKFEESEGRSIDDSPRDQKNVGYDFSSSNAESRRFADIKSSKYDDIEISMQQSEWRKAELEGDNYYLYIVTGLRAGGTPKLRIIQNPVKYLKPDIPSKINVSNWKHAIRYEVTYLRQNATQPPSENPEKLADDEKH